MRWEGETPRFLNIPSKTNNHYSLTVLGNAVIGSVDLLENNAIAQTSHFASGVMFLQSSQMFGPSLVFPEKNFWILELKKYVTKILCKRFSE